MSTQPARPDQVTTRSRATQRQHDLGLLFSAITWCILAAALGFAVAVYLLSRTNYVQTFDQMLANGWGPYQVALSLVVLALLLRFGTRLVRTARAAFLAREITVVDKLTLAFCLWWIAPWYLVALPSVDWTKVQGVVAVCRTVAIPALLWLFGRLLLVVYLRMRHEQKASWYRLFSDRPLGILVEDVDLLGRGNIVTQLVSAIQNYDGDGALVVAVTGEWGEGKTSVLNLARRQLKAESADRTIVVDFSPWYFSIGNGQNLDTILKRFFDALERGISPLTFRPALARSLRRYYRLLSPVLKSAPLNLDSLFDETSPDLGAMKAELSKAFARLGRTIVVIIDDLDRMTPQETAFVFKLIHLCADFDGLVYVLAYDAAYVSQQLDSQYLGRGREYVEKIVQLELPLPQVEQSVTAQLFWAFMSVIEERLGIVLLHDPDFVEHLRSVYAPHVSLLVSNLRLTKLLANRLLLVVPAVKGEVNYYDLLVLEIIRLRYPHIYQAVYQNPRYFSYQNSINWIFPSSNDPVDQIRKFYDYMVQGLDQDSREAVFALLGSVFNSVQAYHRHENIIWDYNHDSTYRERQSAAHPYYFPRYFLLGVQQGVLSDVVWNKLVDGINASSSTDQMHVAVSEMIERCAAVGDRWLRRLSVSMRRLRTDRIPALAIVIAAQSAELSNDLDPSGDFNDFRLAHFLLDDLLEHLEPDQAEALATQLVRESPNLYHLLYALGWFDAESGLGRHIAIDRRQATQAALKQLAAERLRTEYVEPRRNLLQEKLSHGGLRALIQFLEPAEYQPYIGHLLESDTNNAVLLLRSLISRGQWMAGISSGNYRIFDYPTARQLTDPELILKALEVAQSTLEAAADDKWAIAALHKGLERERAGKGIERVEETDRD